jgi:hypothetical protein
MDRRGRELLWLVAVIGVESRASSSCQILSIASGFTSSRWSDASAGSRCWSDTSRYIPRSGFDC